MVFLNKLFFSLFYVFYRLLLIATAIGHQNQFHQNETARCILHIHYVSERNVDVLKVALF